ncbi:uncharacterized protein LOC144033716 [Festucalex cinctus]
MHCAQDNILSFLRHMAHSPSNSQVLLEERLSQRDTDEEVVHCDDTNSSTRVCVKERRWRKLAGDGRSFERLRRSVIITADTHSHASLLHVSHMGSSQAEERTRTNRH